MTIEISDFIDVKARVEALGCLMPTGITIIPDNFQRVKTENSYYYLGTDIDLRTILRENGLSGTSLEDENGEYPVLLRESISPDWLPPIIFIGEKIIAENSPAIQVALGVISNYIYERLKEFRDKKSIPSHDVEFHVVFKSKGVYKKLDYKGPPEESALKEVRKTISELGKE
jgi:hypothetical protein